MSAITDAEHKLDELYANISSKVKQLGDDAQQEMGKLAKDAEKTVITTSIAPLHVGIMTLDEQTTDGSAKTLIESDQNAWNSYADNFDSSAKGQWAQKARSTIRKQVKGLDSIE